VRANSLVLVAYRKLHTIPERPYQSRGPFILSCPDTPLFSVTATSEFSPTISTSYVFTGTVLKRAPAISRAKLFRERKFIH